MYIFSDKDCQIQAQSNYIDESQPSVLIYLCVIVANYANHHRLLLKVSYKNNKMDTNLEHEDLLIKLRAKLNEEKIKLWEPPYHNADDINNITSSLQDLANKYALALQINVETILNGLRELQLNAIDRVKANEEFKDTGLATFRVKTSIAGEKQKLLKVSKKLSAIGEELHESVAGSLSIDKNRIKLIYKGKVIKSNLSLEEQGVKNGAQILALVMIESPEETKKEESMYMQMKSTLEDATLLSEKVDELDDDEYMKLEDQSGKAVSLPTVEKRSLMIGLALHERGRAAARSKEYSLALILFLEADKQFSECRSSILSSVDNWAVLQLDIAWCYLCLQSLSSAEDAAARLARADAAFRASYGEDFQRVIALKGNAANERVLFARLYLLQGIVAYHQNKRAEAKTLLEKAERELNSLRVDEESVRHLTELGWSPAQARWGLRAGGGCDRAHEYLLEVRRRKQAAREKHRQEREQRALGLCLDGSLVSASALDSLLGMGFKRALATAALRNANNNVTDAVRLIQDHPEMFDSDDSSSSGTGSDDVPVELDNKLVAELEAMGYSTELVREALRRTKNRVSEAVDLLLEGGVLLACDTATPSTSAGASRKRQRKEERNKKKKERETALRRLKKAIDAEEDDYFGASLSEEEQFLARYKSLV